MNCYSISLMIRFFSSYFYRIRKMKKCKKEKLNRRGGGNNSVREPNPISDTFVISTDFVRENNVDIKSIARFPFPFHSMEFFGSTAFNDYGITNCIFNIPSRLLETFKTIQECCRRSRRFLLLSERKRILC